MSEYDDRRPGQSNPMAEAPKDAARLREEAMHEMWRELKEKLRSFFQKSEGEHKGPPH